MLHLPFISPVYLSDFLPVFGGDFRQNLIWRVVRVVEGAALEMDWSFITYLTVRIKDNAVTKQHFYCSDRQKVYCYCSAKAIYYKQRTEKGGDRA